MTGGGYNVEEESVRSISLFKKEFGGELETRDSRLEAGSMLGKIALKFRSLYR